MGLFRIVENRKFKNKLHVLIICPGFTNSNIRKKALQGDGSQQGESPRSEQKMMSSEKVALEMIKAIKKRKDTLVLTNSGKLTVLLNKFFSKFVDKLVFNHMSKEPGSPF